MLAGISPAAKGLGRFLMSSLMMDIKVRESYTHNSAAARTGAASGGSDSSFSDILEMTYTGGTTSYDAYFDAAAETYGVPVGLLKAVGMVESGFNANAVSSCGAQGVMQLMPSTAKSLGVTNAFDPAQNIMGGAKFLKQMLDMFNGDVSLALAGYNAGPGAVQKYGGIPPYAETQAYVRKVLSYAGADISAIPTGGTNAQQPAVQQTQPAQSIDLTDDANIKLPEPAELSGVMQQLYSSDEKINADSVKLILELAWTSELDDVDDEEKAKAAVY